MKRSYKITLVIFLFFILKSLYADILLVGYIHNDDGFIWDAPLGDNNVWKTFRYQATVNGRIDYFQMYLGGFGDSLETNNEVGWAVYEDDNGLVGTLKVSGYVSNYDWTIIGTRENHIFPLTQIHQNRNIIEGNNYWITFHASGGRNILISRGRVGCCQSPSPKKGTNQYSWNIFNMPPTPDEFVNTYGDGTYGWAVFQADSNNTAPTILNNIDDVYRDEDFEPFVIADLDTVFYDADSPDRDNLSFTSMPTTGLVNTQILGTELRISSISDLNGIDTIIVVATDNRYASAIDTFFITINPLPDPPSAVSLLSPINNQQLSVTDNISFEWYSSIDADNDPIFYDLYLFGTGKESTLTNISDTTFQFIDADFFEENSQYNWNIISNDGIYSVPSTETFSFYTPPLNEIIESPLNLPDSYKLYQNYPNPFNPSTRIKYDLPITSDITIKIFTVLGQLVFNLTEYNKSPGSYTLEFDADLLTSGIYIYQFTTPDYIETKKMIYLR